MADQAGQPGGVTDVSPEMLEGWIRRGEAVVVDVREDFEFAEEHIRGAEHAPLSKFDAADVRARHGGDRLVFQCRSGKRSLTAAEAYRQTGDTGEPLFHLAGGIEAWKQSGRPVVRPGTGPKIPVMRQVQITAGSLVVIGVLLGVLVSPWFLALSAFVGCGLVFAGASGWCGMAMLLGAMPWNKVLGARPAATC